MKLDTRFSRKRLATALSLAALIVAASTTVQAAPAPAALTVAPLPARLHQLLEHFASAQPSFPGVALAVRTPTLNWAGAAGVTDRATHTPLTAGAGFRIASVTKTFTAAAILRLAEDGKLSLADPIGQHLSHATIVLLRHGGYDVDHIRVNSCCSTPAASTTTPATPPSRPSS
jgi:D-alanyl-D-alanine carboxypeptidase